MRSSDQGHVEHGGVPGQCESGSGWGQEGKFENSTLGYVDQYRLVSKSGQGSYGPMYVAEDTVTGRMKFIYVLPGAISKNPVEFECFRKNIALQHDLLHPHIVNIQYLQQAQMLRTNLSEDLRISPGDCLVAMEYASGKTLSEWKDLFPEGRVPAGLAFFICSQIAAALDFAHAQNIVHRDLKPGNVIIEQTPSGLIVRLVNFSLEAEIRSCLSRISTVLGVSARVRSYMSPEQWSGKNQGVAADQYALAVMLHEMVSGEVPFASAFETGDPSLMARVVEEKNSAPLSELSKSQNAVLLKALSKDPALRFPSCSAFMNAMTAQGKNTGCRGIWLFSVLLLVLGAVWVGRQEWRKRASLSQQWADVVRRGSLASPSGSSPEANREAYASGLSLLPATIPEACSSVLPEAAVDLPRLRISVTLDGLSVSDAEVRFDPACPLVEDTYVLQPGQAYVVFVSMPPDSGQWCTVVEHRLTAEWKGLQSWSTELCRVPMRIPPGFKAAEGTIAEPYTGRGWGKEVIHQASGITMVYIPAGKFLTGSQFDEAGRYEGETQHSVTIPYGFYLGQTEVTQGQWQKIMKANPSCFKESGADGPVENISWEDCQNFCQALGVGFYLPSELQWEYACRAGTQTPFHFGSQLEACMANFDGRYPWGTSRPGIYRAKTVAVCQFAANAWGLYDMHGNVWEWCSDDFDSKIPVKNENTEKDLEPQMKKVTRGGGWNSDARYCRAAYREGSPPELRINGLGMRVCFRIPVQ